MSVSNNKKVVYSVPLTASFVDVDTQELVSAWQLILSTSSPIVTKTFELKIPLGVACHKKIAYGNPWNEPRTYTIRSSNDRLLRPRTGTVTIPAEGETFLRFYVAGEGVPMKEDLYVFVNDELDQNEECLLLQTTWK